MSKEDHIGNVGVESSRHIDGKMETVQPLEVIYIIRLPEGEDNEQYVVPEETDLSFPLLTTNDSLASTSTCKNCKLVFKKTSEFQTHIRLNNCKTQESVTDTSVKGLSNVSNNVSCIVNNGIKNLDHKIQLKELGPPRPELSLSQEQKATNARNGFVRKFSVNMYSYADWLCGCNVKNSFFCYACLVMGAVDRMWTVEGVSDIKHLKPKVEKHKLSEKHINACIEYAVLGKADIRFQLNNEHRLSIQKINEEIEKNRYVLSKLIDAVKFCAAFDLGSRGQEEKGSSDSPGIFRDLVSLMSDLDSTLKQHIERTNNRVFLGLSKTIQNELLDSIYAVCLEIIRNELTQTQFIAIEVDETSDCATASHLALVVRYELNGSINERFIGFVEPQNQDPVSVTGAILDELRKLKVDEAPRKLVAQSYDSISVMSGEHTKVQERVKTVYQNAIYVQCYAHQFSSIIERSATEKKEVRLFFSNIEGFSSFFLQSSERIALFYIIVNKQIPKSISTSHWNSKSRVVSTLLKYKTEVEECLIKLRDDNISDYSTVNNAVALIHFLKDDDFNFWLGFFNKIMPHCELQNKTSDCMMAAKCVKKFVSLIQTVKNSSELDSPSTSDPTSEPSEKRGRFEDRRSSMAKEVCDRIMTEVENRFANLDYLTVAKLFQPTLFQKFKNSFPEHELETAVKLFELNKVELKQELLVIYSRRDFSEATGSLRLLNFIYDNNLKQVLPESVKLLRIICTIPFVTAENDRCIYTSKRIKTFIRRTRKGDRLSALAMCSIDKKLLSSTGFNERVIDHFAVQKKRRMDFSYKINN